MRVAIAQVRMSEAATGAVAVVVSALAGIAVAVDLRLGGVLALAAIAVPVALVDLPLALAAWAGLGTLSRSPPFGIMSTAAGLLALGVWLAYARAERGRIRESLRPHRRLLTAVALLLAWLTVSLAWTEDTARAGDKLVDWYVLVAALVVLLSSVRTPRGVRLLITAVVAGVTASVVLGLAGGGLGSAASTAETATSSEGRLQGGAADPNFMAALIVPAVVLAAALRRTAVSPVRALLPPVIVLLVVGLAATQSRGGALGAISALVAALVVMRGKRLSVLGGAALMVSVAAVWFSAYPAGLERLTSGDDRGSGREELWLVARRMSQDHPLGGVGLGNFVVRAPEYVRRPGRLEYVELIADRPHIAHNTYLEILAESGVVGLALFLVFVGNAIAAGLLAARRLERLRERALAQLARAVVVADIGLVTAAFFISASRTATVWVLLALGPVILGIAHAGEPERRRAWRPRHVAARPATVIRPSPGAPTLRGGARSS